MQFRSKLVCMNCAKSGDEVEMTGARFLGRLDTFQLENESIAAYPGVS